MGKFFINGDEMIYEPSPVNPGIVLDAEAGVVKYDFLKFMKAKQPVCDIEVVDADAVELPDGTHVFGVFVPQETKIYVAGNYGYEIICGTIAHELRHYYQHINDLPYDEDDAEEYALQCWDEFHRRDW